MAQHKVAGSSIIVSSLHDEIQLHQKLDCQDRHQVQKTEAGFQSEKMEGKHRPCYV